MEEPKFPADGSKQAERVSGQEAIDTDKKEFATTEPDTVSISSGSAKNLYDSNEFDVVYIEKSIILNHAIQEIGMGRYQWQLFVVAGFGWFSDNLWPIVTSLIFTQVLYELHPPDGRAPYLTLSQNLGLLAGALFWSLSSDLVGRRWAFNITFLVTGVWGVIAGSAPNFASICIFAAFWSFGVGGNLPVDSAIFLEALPHTHQYLLTVMSVWWALGQLVANLIAWGLLGNYSCQEEAGCTRANNMGWRYLLFTVGGLTLIMFISRFVIFTLYESPKFYMSKGQDDRAVDVVHKIAKINRKTSSLTLHQLQAVDLKYGVQIPNEEIVPTVALDTSTKAIFKRRLSKFNMNHIRQVFSTRKLAISSSLVILVWAIIGLAFPLYNAFIPYFLKTRGAQDSDNSTYIVYRNSLIISVLGIPGALLAGVLVELRIGRKGAISLSTILTGVFLFASTTARTQNALLGWNCAYSFTSNIMYGVLYAYTPEIFPSRIRGTAVGLASSANRVLGVFAPIIAMFADLTTSVPIYVSGALFILAGIIVIAFPYEPRGKASL